ncbi:AFG1-like ATPase-domain-containing protein [Baffinella frigidus]|nr:AFG1-like ATPase-domain-containing protein [Cryptophyta sp. CCMP2293]
MASLPRALRSLARLGTATGAHQPAWISPRVHRRAMPARTFAVAARRVTSPLQSNYEAKLVKGTVRPDERQAALVDALGVMLEKLVESVKESGGNTKTKGAYIFGPVGSGKSMVANMAFEAASQLIPGRTLRLHFHDFTTMVHSEMHRAKQNAPSEQAVPAVARGIAEKTSLLYLDEMQVTDIADAAILSRLIAQLFALGVCVLFTTNRAPTELYKDGLNRHVYMPQFERLLAKHCHVIDFAAGDTPHIDYRIGGLPTPILYSPASPAGDASMQRLWERVAALELSANANPNFTNKNPSTNKATNKAEGAEKGGGGEGVGQSIPLPFGRSMVARRVSKRAVWLDFEEAFCRPLGPGDYVSLASRFDVFFLSGVPVLSLKTHNEANRFLKFIDTVYDSACAVVIQAEAEPAELLRMVDEAEGGQSLTGYGEALKESQQTFSVPKEVIMSVRKEGGSSSSSSTTFIGDTEWSSTGLVGVSLAALSAVRDVTFSKERAVSRLTEMRCAAFLVNRPRGAVLLQALEEV